MDTNKYKMFCSIVTTLFTIFCFIGSLYYNKEVWGGYLLGVVNCALVYEFFIEPLSDE